MSRSPTAAAVARKLNEIELLMLRQVVEQQHAELIALRDRLHYAEDAAESWREDALALHRAFADVTGGRPGITQAGELVVAGSPA